MTELAEVDLFPDGEPETAKPRRGGRKPPTVPWVPPEEKPPLEPVVILIARECHFKKKPPHPETGKKQNGCLRCGNAKSWEGHLGVPPSLNVGGSGQNHFTYQNTKKAWQAIMEKKLAETGLPRGLGRITVEGEMCFGDRADRDQGNFRYLVEKALGDMLEDQGYLENDAWARYEFGNLKYRYEKGVAYTKLMLFPSWETPDLRDPDASPQLFM
jgi:hypothetical protein